MTEVKRRKVWMITSHFYPVIGGAERQVQRVSHLLHNRNGRDVQILTRRHSIRLPEVEAYEVVDDVPVHRLYSRGWLKLGAVLYVAIALWHLLRKGRGDIYHAHGIGAPAWIAILAQHFGGGTSVVKLRNGIYNYTNLLKGSWFSRQTFLRSIHSAQYLIVVNSVMIDFLIDLDVPRHKIFLIPNGIDTQVFTPPTPEKRQRSRLELGVADDVTVFLYVGRLSLATKDIDTLLRAWQYIIDDPTARLFILGDGADRHKLEKLHLELKLGESVTFLGANQEVMPYLHAADVVTLVSRSEGLSNAMLEAMACGLPIIASSVDGALDYIEPFKNGLLYTSENAEELARHIKTMLTWRDKLHEMGRNAREKVRNDAELTIIADRLNNLYNQI